MSSPEPCDNIYIGDLPVTMDDGGQLLSQIFGAYGKIKSFKMLPAGGPSGKKAALLQFSSIDEAKWVVENLNGNIPQGLTEPIQVRYKDNSSKGKGKAKNGFGPYGDASAGMGDMGGMGGMPGMAAWTPTWGGASKGKGGIAEQPPVESNNLFVGDLPGTIDEAQLTSVLSAYGQITEVKLLPPVASGKRAALIRFASVAEAKWIVDNLNGNIPQGMSEPIAVKYKMPPPGKGCGGFPGGCCGGFDGFGKGDKGFAKGGGKGCAKTGPIGIKQLVDGILESGALPGGTKYTNDENTLFVGGLPEDTTDEDIFLMFSPFGAIAPRGVRAMANEDKSACKGFGFVNFLDYRSSQVAIDTLNGTQYDGKSLKVCRKQDKGGGGKGIGKGGDDWGMMA